MPKNTDAEEQGSEVPAATEESGKQVSKKELGRLKSKQAVLAKVQAGAGGSGAHTNVEEEVEEPESKKSRSDAGEDTKTGEESNVDVQME